MQQGEETKLPLFARFSIQENQKRGGEKEMP